MTGNAEDLQAEQLYRWEFQRSEDRNADQWPDGWRRRTGRNFPGYIPVRIVWRDPVAAKVARDAEPILSRFWLAYRSGKYFKAYVPESTPEPIAAFNDRFLVNNCLSVEMDGGAVELESPAFPLDPRFTYTLDASLSTKELHGHNAWVELLLLDQRGNPIGSGKTSSASGSTDWRVYTTSSLTSEALHMGQVVVHVDKLPSTRLNGTVLVDEIRIYRMPKLELTVGAPHHVALPNQPIEITCTALGVTDARSTVNFKLIDHSGTVIDQKIAPLVPLPATNSSPRTELDGTKGPLMVSTNGLRPPRSDPKIVKGPSSKGTALPMNSLGPKKDKGLPGPSRMDGVAKWTLQVTEPDYYRVIVDLGRTTHNSESRLISREASLAIVADDRVGVGGPFGWSLPDFNAQFTPEVVPELVQLGGVGWLKIPVWYHPADQKSGDRLSLLLERLDLKKVNCVGLLDQPAAPGDETKKQLPAAALFSIPQDWEPLLEPALTRMSMKLTRFQLGRDHDRSFVGNPTLVPLVTDIRNRMQAFCQELQLALTWDYQDTIPSEKSLPWRANQMSCDPQLTSRELQSHLKQAERPGQIRWVTLDPIPASRYRMLDRVRDLTERMITIKENKVEAAFLTAPLDRETGIFNADGSVGELFLPWRLLNQTLATANFLGSISMPGGSTNYVFEEGGEGCMILWNDRNSVEQLYLGEDVKGVDLWGQSLPIEQTQSDIGTPEQKLSVTAWPVLLRGISIPVANWRMRFQLTNKTLPSAIAARTELPIVVTNTLSQSAFGTVTLVSPTLLQAGLASTRLQLSSGQQQNLTLPVPLRADASAGKHTLRFDFQISGERDYTFSVYDSLALGIGDVELQWETVELSKDRAVLRVELNNNTNRPVSFDCKLFPPKQPYRRVQITDAAPGQTFRDMVLPLRDLEGESMLWIRCEELGSGRVLNYRVPLKT